VTIYFRSLAFFHGRLERSRGNPRISPSARESGGLRSPLFVGRPRRSLGGDASRLATRLINDPACKKPRAFYRDLVPKFSISFSRRRAGMLSFPISICTHFTDDCPFSVLYSTDLVNDRSRSALLLCLSLHTSTAKHLKHVHVNKVDACCRSRLAKSVLGVVY